MNIQPSVIVWTVICFLLLMVILKNLLFKPVLEVLDKRKEKVDFAEQKLRDIESISAKNQRLIAEEKARAEAESVAQAKEEVKRLSEEAISLLDLEADSFLAQLFKSLIYRSK